MAQRNRKERRKSVQWEARGWRTRIDWAEEECEDDWASDWASDAREHDASSCDARGDDTTRAQSWAISSWESGLAQREEATRASDAREDDASSWTARGNDTARAQSWAASSWESGWAQRDQDQTGHVWQQQDMQSWSANDHTEPLLHGSSVVESHDEADAEDQWLAWHASAMVVEKHVSETIPVLVTKVRQQADDKADYKGEEEKT